MQYDTPAEEGFEFRGSTPEWFGIWIVNLFLTIITVGIYSAWAKVRTKKYFYQNTYVAGRNFDYHATGLQIFIGRLIMIVAFVMFSILSSIPIVGLVAILGLLVALPWLMVRSFKFNAQMSSWSNVRFGFSGSYVGALLAFIVYPILTALTLYLTFPFLDRAVKRFSLNNHSLGGHSFAFDAPIAPFYTAFLAAIAWIIGVSAIIGSAVFASLGGIDIEALATNPNAALPLIIAIYAIAFLAFFPAATVYGAFVRNVTLNNMALEGGHEFFSNVKAMKLVWIALSNAIVVVCSLGLLLPWAQVRMFRYLTKHTALIPGGPLDQFVGQLETRAGALGDAYTDIEGIDLGLPV